MQNQQSRFIPIWQHQARQDQSNLGSQTSSGGRYRLLFNPFANQPAAGGLGVPAGTGSTMPARQSGSQSQNSSLLTHQTLGQIAGLSSLGNQALRLGDNLVNSATTSSATPAQPSSVGEATSTTSNNTATNNISDLLYTPGVQPQGGSLVNSGVQSSQSMPPNYNPDLGLDLTGADVNTTVPNISGGLGALSGVASGIGSLTNPNRNEVQQAAGAFGGALQATNALAGMPAVSSALPGVTSAINSTIGSTVAGIPVATLAGTLANLAGLISSDLPADRMAAQAAGQAAIPAATMGLGALAASSGGALAGAGIAPAAAAVAPLLAPVAAVLPSAIESFFRGMTPAMREGNDRLSFQSHASAYGQQLKGQLTPDSFMASLDNIGSTPEVSGMAIDLRKADGSFMPLHGPHRASFQQAAEELAKGGHLVGTVSSLYHGMAQNAQPYADDLVRQAERQMFLLMGANLLPDEQAAPFRRAVDAQKLSSYLDADLVNDFVPSYAAQPRRGPGPLPWGSQLSLSDFPNERQRLIEYAVNPPSFWGGAEMPENGGATYGTGDAAVRAPHLLNLYGVRVTPEEYELFRPKAFWEQPNSVADPNVTQY